MHHRYKWSYSSGTKHMIWTHLSLTSSSYVLETCPTATKARLRRLTKMTSSNLMLTVLLHKILCQSSCWSHLTWLLVTSSKICKRRVPLELYQKHLSPNSSHSVIFRFCGCLRIRISLTGSSCMQMMSNQRSSVSSRSVSHFLRTRLLLQVMSAI